MSPLVLSTAAAADGSVESRSLNTSVLDDSGFQVIDMAESIQPFTVLNQTRREFGLVWLDHEWVSPPTAATHLEIAEGEKSLGQGGKR